MPQLVALALPGGPAFVAALQDVWDAGDAAFPLDLRLPPAERERVLAAVRPSVVVDEHGERHRRSGGGAVEPGDALVVATSGSTGEPKGVVLTHDAVASSARATSARLAVDPSRDHWLACLPLAHVGGLSVVTRALLTGTPVTVLPGFEPGAVEEAARRGATLVSLVATALRRADTSAYRVVVVGGAAPPAPLPANAVATYGMTETGSGVVYDGEPLPGVDVRIRAGHIHLRGPMLLRCYRDGTDPRDAAGWLPTGDEGELGSDGRLVVHGRRGELIVTGGEKVWPAPVEAVVEALAGVAEAAVAPRPDPEWGQRVVVFVVPADPARLPTLAEVRAAVKERLAPYAAPRELVLVERLPRTTLGKVRRSQLPGVVAPGR
ncbi:MAG: AMP-binding protein [Acidimicrobiales bacterium]|nr:AMP-binding protein [Acidimicrobiales bacterium]